MTDNALFKVTSEFAKCKCFTEDNIMEWQPSFPDMNTIEIIWQIVKMKLYGGVHKYEKKWTYQKQLTHVRN